ncbi:MAG TPA: ATP-binding protein [Thermomicrobiales bacterium]|jgi:signal transduction histidine kinase
MTDHHGTPVESTTDPSPRDEASAREPLPIAAYEAALAIASEVDLPAVLQRLVDLARQVVPARYAALGVADAEGKIVEFITSGISAEERAAIGPIPQGHGMLGELIKTGRPLLVPDIAADPRSVGFPPHHPPMHTLLGVPILLAGRPLGNLYLTERLDSRPFDERDLGTLQVLAAHAATTIDRARLYRQIEEARRRAEEQRDQLRTILDNLPVGVLIRSNPNAAIELANASAVRMVFGPTAPAGALPAFGRDFHLLHADGSPVLDDQQPGKRALRGETVRNRQLILAGWDGQRLPILVQAAPLRDARGEITRAVVVFQDIARLREAEQLKDDFLSLISHEFRTPLTAIHGGAHLLATQGATLDEETRQELLADIVLESDRLDRMLTNMLSLTAIRAGRLEPATEPVLVEPLARRVAREVGERSPNHAFVVAVAAGLPPVEADPDLLAQVLRNLFENAVKYSPGGGEIRISGRRDGEQVEIRVTDQGSGIAAEHVPHVFERFRRPGADPTVRGMGLGLYLSRHLVEAQGGRIGAESPGPGLGATFSVVLPIARGWDVADPGTPAMALPRTH